MSRPLVLALVTLAYVAFLLVTHRFKLARARRGGLRPESLSRFDHRGLLDELQELYEAGLPPQSGPAPDDATPLTAPAALGRPVDWVRPDVWEASALESASEAVREARDRIRGGHDGQVAALIEPGQPTEVDQQLTSLGIHFFLTRLYRGEREAAARVLAGLPAWTNGRISQRVVEKYLAQLAFIAAEEARIKGTKERWRHADAARRHLRAADATGTFAEAGTRALWAQLRLGYYTHLLNLEWSLFRADRVIKRGLAEHKTSSMLFYALALSTAFRGKSEDAVDHLARALYYSNGDPFYVRAVLEIPEVARVKPTLVRQVQARFGPQAETAVEGESGAASAN